MRTASIALTVLCQLSALMIVFSVDPPIFPPCITAADLGATTYLNSTGLQAAIKLCFQRVKDAQMWPGYVDGTLMNVTHSISLNNLVSLSEVDNTITLDFFHFMEYVEPRFSMPDLWDQFNAQGNPVQEIELNALLGETSIDGTTYNIWQPLINCRTNKLCCHKTVFNTLKHLPL